MSSNPPKVSIFRRLYEAVIRRGGVTVGESGVTSTVYPDVNFQTCIDLLLGDPDVSASIEFIAYVPVGNGFETTMNEDYKEKTKIKDANGHETELSAKEVVDQKCKEFGYDELLQEFAQDIVGVGNSWVWKGNSAKFEKCVRILPYWVQKVDFKDGKISELILQSPQDIPSKIDGRELVWLSYNHSGKDRLGIGILQGLLTSYTSGGETRPPFATIKAKVQKAMMDQIEQFSSYGEMWIFEGLPKSDLPTVANEVRGLKKPKRITSTYKGNIVRSIPERMRGLDFYVDTLWNSFYLSLKTPYPKLVLGGSFTEASANAAIGVAEMRTAALRRYLKRVSETEFFDKWVEEAGLDPKQAQVRLHWRLLRLPDMSVLMSILAKLNELGTLQNSEIRQILIDMGLPIKKAEIASPPSQAQTSTPLTPSAQQPQISAEKKHQATPRNIP